MNEDVPLPFEQPITDAQSDVELFPWVVGIHPHTAGDFLNNIADAARRADPENYAIMRPALLQLAAKYPEYFKKGLDVLKQFPDGGAGAFPYGAKKPEGRIIL